MENLYIDESGSMTTSFSKSYPYFVIAIVRTKNPDRLRKLYNRFVRSHMNDLMTADRNNRMFSGGKFQELKGSSFTPQLKKEFVSYFCKNDLLEVYYIRIVNASITKGLYDNTARAFNYVLKLALEHFITHGMLPVDEYCIQLDERNEKTNTRYFLEQYLNTEFRMAGVLQRDVKVSYFNSETNKIVQIADVFANLYFSHLMTGNYAEEIKTMEENDFLKCLFRFPFARR